MCYSIAQHDVSTTGSEFWGAEQTLKVLANEGYFDKEDEEEEERDSSGGPPKVPVWCILLVCGGCGHVTCRSHGQRHCVVCLLKVLEVGDGASP